MENISLKTKQSKVDNSYQELLMLRQLLPWKDLETKKFFDDLDQELVERLIFNKVKQYNLEEPSFIGKDSIKDQRIPSKLIAFYLPHMEMIVFDPEKFKENFISEIRQIAFLNIIIHEQVHAGSYHLLSEGQQREYYEHIVQVGFDTVTSKIDINKKKLLSQERRWEFWNEGVTELFTQEILKEYALYKGLEGVYKEYMQVLEKDESINIRPDSVKSVRSIIRQIADSIGQDEGFVRESVFRGMFEGESYLQRSVRDEIDKMFEKGFTKKLSKK